MSTTSKIQVDTKTFVRFWLVILGFAVVALLLIKAAPGLLIIGAALFLALAISPLVSKLARLIPGKGRTLPIALSYIIVVGFLAVFFSIVVPTIISESVRFVGTLPETINNASFDFDVIDRFGNSLGIQDLQGQISATAQSFSADFVKNFGSNLSASLSTLSNIATALILVLVLAFFMLTEGPQILQAFWQLFHNNPEATRAHRTLDRMAVVISKYVSGAITVSLINACTTAITVFIFGLIFNFSADLALPLGLLTGVFSLIPMFGSFIGGCIAALLLAFNTLGAGIAFLIYVIVYLQIESNIISPKIQSKALRLPPLIVLASVTIGVYMFGLIGAIIAIPIAGCIKVFLEEYGKDLAGTETSKPKATLV